MGSHSSWQFLYGVMEDGILKNLIKLEYKKMWNGVSLVSMIALSILTILFALVTLNLQQRTIDNEGNIVSGLPSFRALKEAARDLEGVMDGEYIQNLIEDYNASIDKAYLNENKGFLGTGGMTKYIVTNYVLNYAYYGPYMSNGNDKINLDYEFLNSEESFYRKYKDAIMEHLLYVNEENGLFHFSEEQINAIKSKIEDIKTPFRVEYSTGLANLNVYFSMEYSVFFILLVFCLASIYAKDSVNGINELTLSCKHGRKKDMMARWIAGNLFTLTTYLIYVGMLMAVHGSIASLHGLGASAQTFWFECIYNINIGTGLLTIFFGGLAGALVISNIVMLLSIKIKNSKITTAAGIIFVWVLGKGASTYSQIKLLNPRQFGGSDVVTGFLFIGRTIIPYFVVVILLSVVYVVLIWLAMRPCYKKYYLN